MESWTVNTPAPNLKFEHSPAESYLSTPDEMYPSLFQPATLNPLEMMSPKSFADDSSDVALLAGLTPAPETPSANATPEPEKKPVKKRKSWGQVLPEPKTNLPPRKRAKTEDEKEQRRVERVLRNRRAAQSSRERKRQEVECLEKRNKELEALLRQVQQTNMALAEELRKYQTPTMARASATFDALRPSPVTFSQELFSSQDGHNLPTSADSLEQLLTAVPANNTVNPASLSPTLTPVPEAEEEEEEVAMVAAPAADSAPVVNTSPDATRHPAAMLCQDLLCPLAEVPPLMAASQPLHPTLSLLLLCQLLLTSASTMASLCQRPLMQIAMSLKAGFSLPPTPAILNTIILLVTNPSPSKTSTSTTSSPTITSRMPTSSSRSNNPSVARPQSRRSSTLRLRILRKILTCSPTLARPLKDATMEALRLVSTEGYQVDRVSGDDDSAAAATNGESQQQKQDGRHAWLKGAKLPSKEVLMTLLWVLQTEERRLQIRLASSKPGRSGVPTAPTDKFVLRVLPKRSYGAFGAVSPDTVSLKRRRVE
ncbi:hypothetical protein QBC47DRAFT_440624 [Echria macrotheca]|uniref:BZIP domain-containing protein n=1 Tax=Echria macrotheca TaxID=438768 RepID=A0AAJ0F7M6_9PEZI|nr:hypothetical protein QBC47DRAFT_440624 [Echria macrotheca]